MNSLDMIDQEIARAAAPKGSRKPTFLFLKEGHKALVRPLINLDSVLVMAMHHKFAQDAGSRVNSVCAREIGKECAYCQRSADDRKLTAGTSFMLPLYVYSVTDTKSGQQVMYTDPDTSLEKPVQGIRVLELTVYGTISAVLKSLRSFYSDDDDHSIIGNDFVIEQIGSGQQKSFVCMPKGAKPMAESLKKSTPTNEQIKARIVDACPPLVAGGAVVEQEVAEVEDGDIPVF